MPSESDRISFHDCPDRGYYWAGALLVRPGPSSSLAYQYKYRVADHAYKAFKALHSLSQSEVPLWIRECLRTDPDLIIAICLSGWIVGRGITKLWKGATRRH
jgi:hypothetical protein